MLSDYSMLCMDLLMEGEVRFDLLASRDGSKCNGYDPTIYLWQHTTYTRGYSINSNKVSE